MEIHFLKGTGSNCTCGDCSVLYGGRCYTTPINNWLDRVERIARRIYDEKPYICKTDLRKFLDSIGPLVCKRYKISIEKYSETYYGWSPLFFTMISFKVMEGGNYDVASARLMYRRSRFYLLRALESANLNLK